MKLILFAAVAIITWAAFIVISGSVDPLNTSKFVAATVLTLAVAIQRIGSVQRWLSSPKNRRKDQVDALAQQTFINLCRDKTVSPDLRTLYIHVWEVPLWYRRIFPYQLRQFLKSIIRRNPFRTFTRWVFRPKLQRVVAVGFVKRAPSGVRFYKGIGLIGVCIFNNDPAEIISLRVTDTDYRKALASDNETLWAQNNPSLTHRLSLEDAQRLSHSYGQVVAKVIREPETGEAIGCVTISCRNATSQEIRITKDQLFLDQLDDLSQSTARILA